MVGVLFLLLLAVPIAELYVIVQVAQGIGVLETIGLLIAVSVLGAWLLKQQGLQTWARIQESLSQGRMPAGELVDGALILLGGALLLTPGFLTDVVGLVFVLPPTRAALKVAARRLLARWAERRIAPGMRVYRTTVIRSRDVSRPGSTTPPEEPPGSRPPTLPHGEDGFRDKG